MAKAIFILILLIAIFAIGQYRFSLMVENEKEILQSHFSPIMDQFITNEGISHLPPVVQKWMHTSGALNKPETTSLRLTQTGRMKTKPDGKWMEFSANQYFDVKHPAFLWTTRVNMMPLIHLSGRDKLINGKGEMMIKLLSLIKVVDEGSDEKINSGALLRFLAEMVWFPAAACNDYLEWQEIGPLTTKATLTTDGKRVSGVFRFNETGDFHSFEAERYYGGGPDATQNPWLIEATGYKNIHGYRIPHKAKVTWKLPEGDFMWLELEITAMKYNYY